jgi:hypothetical protein
MQVVLVMFRGDGERRSFSVVRNMTVIGRREDCDLRIPLGDVSRKHCRLVRTDDGIRLEDLGSTHGTLVNGQRVREVELNAGDTIGVGPVMFVVQIDGVPAEDELASPQRAAAEAAVAADDSMAAVHHAPAGHEDDLAAGEEFPLEELASDELVLDEVPAEPAAAVHPEAEEMMLEEVPLEEVPLEATPGGNDRTVDHTPAEAGFDEPVTAADEMTADRVSAVTPAAAEDEVEELDWLDEEPAAPATTSAAAPPPPPLPPGLSIGSRPPVPPPLATPAAAEPEAEFELEEVSEEATHEVSREAPAAQPEHVPAAEGDWDFVVEETEGDHAHSDFHINLESHHDQPHG